MTDPIADLLTRIRNAQRAGKEKTVIEPASNIKLDILKIFKKEGYLEKIGVKSVDNKSFVEVGLKYVNNKPAFSGVVRVSRPGQRVYVKKDKVPYVLQGFGLAIISTSKGLMTDKEARKQGLGGELICKIW
ncbi:MAG: 30S ribosomal protein S8 [bacterium]|nr:30S ribosomal protein S8 [bacterium]